MSEAKRDELRRSDEEPARRAQRVPACGNDTREAGEKRKAPGRGRRRRRRKRKALGRGRRKGEGREKKGGEEERKKEMYVVLMLVLLLPVIAWWMPQYRTPAMAATVFLVMASTSGGKGDVPRSRVVRDAAFFAGFAAAGYLVWRHV